MLIAVHEAGHAVVASLLDFPVVYIKLTSGGGRTRYHVNRHAPLCEAAVAVAGPLAQDRYAPTPTPALQRSAWRKGWREDLAIMRRHLDELQPEISNRRIATVLGVDEGTVRNDSAPERRKANKNNDGSAENSALSGGANQREQWLVCQVRVAVRQHWRVIEAVAAALYARGTLSGAEIQGLIRDG
jgi:hypothetical protein